MLDWLWLKSVSQIFLPDLQFLLCVDGERVSVAGTKGTSCNQFLALDSESVSSHQD